MTTTRFSKVAGAAALLFAAGCSDSHYNILNTNAPTVDQLTGAPTKGILGRAALGIAAASAFDLGGEISFFAIFGREGYNLLGNDPRLTQEMLRGPLESGGFGGANFFGKYQALRSINEYLKAVDASGLTAAEKSASKGYAQTIKAVLLLRTIVRNGALGAPIAVEVGLDQPPAPFVNQAGVYTYILAQLDEAKAALQAGGATFPFAMPAGYDIAGTPASFIKFNRAVAAKAQVLRATLAGGGNAAYTAALTALSESFISRTGSLQDGVFYAFSEASGEPNNPISENLSAQRFYVNNSLATGAQLKGDGQTRDDRFLTKVKPAIGDAVNRTQGSLPLHNWKPAMFNNADGSANLGADIAIVRNEELILLAAEANWFAGSKQAAIDDINVIRTRSGGLAPTTLTAGSTNAQFVTELVYNRLYSLLWEQGTRWVDARRFVLKATLPNDRAGDVIFDNMLVPATECDARGLPVPCTPQTQ